MIRTSSKTKKNKRTGYGRTTKTKPSNKIRTPEREIDRNFVVNQQTLNRQKIAIPHECDALPDGNTRTKVGPRPILRWCGILQNEVATSDLHRTKLGPRTKGYRVDAVLLLLYVQALH